MEEITSRLEYIAQVNNYEEKKKSILAVKTHLETVGSMNIVIKNAIAKCYTLDNTPIAELPLTSGFIGNQLGSDLEYVEGKLTEIDASFKAFLNS